MKPNTAFVAMKFDGDHWKDKRYSIIGEVLKEAGFDPIRSDQIRSSGPVVDEVWNYLEKSPLVVIDDTGNSLSVSYEIGYCHGIKRAPKKTILLRQGHDIPFNYRHFRHHCYRDLRHLRRLLRDWLKVLTPLSDDHLGYSFTFEVLPGATNYGMVVAECFLQSLQKAKFTGRAEFFAVDRIFEGETFYTISLGLKFVGKQLAPNYKWWIKFQDDVVSRIHLANCHLKHAESCSEMNRLGAMRKTMLLRAIAQFDSGLPVLLVDGDSAPEDSWFIGAINNSLNRGLKIIQIELQ
jgi:hypothetical protein